MLGQFPVPYPEELFYSMCARFSDRMQFPNKRSVVKEVFGAEITAVVDFPGRLNNFISVLPPGHRYTANTIIDNHTLLPFYALFLTQTRVRCLREEMCQLDGRSSTARRALSAICRPRSTYIRFCPVCVQRDRERYGECYWHRVHQLPGVKVCPGHGALLEESNVPLKKIANRYQFLSAESSIREACSHPLGQSNNHHKALFLDIARDAAWLLKQHNLASAPELVRRRYLHLLADQELATYTGVVRQSKLEVAFRSHYSSEFLAQLGYELDESLGQNWLARLVQSNRSAMPPVMHLLLMHFLGCTAEGFFSLPVEKKPFGEGPWPCLNPVSDHYGQLVVHKCEIVFTRRQGKPRGIFSCECGFVYSRVGQDQVEEDRFRRDRVNAYGTVWEAELERLWQSPTITVQQIAERLQVTYDTVCRHARRIGFSFPRPKPDISARRNEYRRKWLSVVEKNPGVGIGKLQSKESGLYAWLMRHDPEWLDQHSPRFWHGRTCVDWDARDRELADEIASFVQRLKASPGRPVRITLRKIIMGINHIKWPRGMLHKLPLTSEVLQKVLETLEDAYLCRVKWAMDCYLREGGCPSRREFVRRAGIWKYAAMPKVEEATVQALHVLCQQGNQDLVENKLENLVEYREAWLRALRENPEAGISALKAKYRVLYDQLQKHDTEWFEAHKPPPRKLGRKRSSDRRVDWQARDQRISALIGPIAEHLKCQPGRPARITIRAIANELGSIYPIYSCLDRLPMTAKALEDVVETPEMLALRRINWAVACYCKEENYPTRSQLVRRTSIVQYIKLPHVEEAVEAALEALKAHFCLSMTHDT